MGTTTTKLGLYKPTAGETGWGTLVDGNFDTLDSKTLPTGWYDLSNVLTHGGADNTAALQAVIDSVPSISSALSGAVFLWPSGNFVFNSTVSWGGKSIRNIGAGSTSYSAANMKTAISAGADSITIFECDGGASGTKQSAGFEGLTFSGNSHTSVIGLKYQRCLRGRVRDCSFQNLSTGIELNENAQDCAWHVFEGNTFYTCTTGLHSTSSNHMAMLACDFVSCTTAVDLAGTTNQWTIMACNFNMISSTVGVAIAGYANVVSSCHTEMNSGTTGCTGYTITATSVSSTHGSGNRVTGATMIGGNTGSSTNVGIALDANTTDNQVDYAWQTSFHATLGAVISDLGTRNRVNGGGYTEAVANRPSGVISTAGVVNVDPSTGIWTISNGAAWVATPGGASWARSLGTYSASITPDVTNASMFKINVTNGTAFTINAPTGAVDGQIVVFVILNSSGGTMGDVTWESHFRTLWSNATHKPTNNHWSAITYIYEAASTSWFHCGGVGSNLA
jgi:hypothetical protein